MNKKKKRLRSLCSVAALAATLLTACKEDGCAEETRPEQMAEETEVELSEDELVVVRGIAQGCYRRSLCEVDDIIAELPFDGANKGLRTVSEVRPVTISQEGCLRGLEMGMETMQVGDTLAYVVNFEDSMGYAVLSSDIRIPEEVLCYSETGNLGDSTDNPGFAYFLSLAEDYMLERIADFEVREDSLLASATAKIELGAGDSDGLAVGGMKATPLPDNKLTRGIRITKVSPWNNHLMKQPLSVVEWNQHHNKYTKALGCNGNAELTGCVMVGLAQIMAYWKYPVRFQGHSYNWNEIVKYSDSYSEDANYNREKYLPNAHWEGNVDKMPMEDQISRLMYDLVKNVGADVGCDGTSASTCTGAERLRDMGYNVEDGCTYDSAKVRSSLDAGRIVLMSGKAIKEKHSALGIRTYNEYKKGHCWNVDGYLIQRRITTYQYNKLLRLQNYDVYSERCFVHVNWGWGGYRNGYYANGVFNSNTYPDYDSAGNKGNKKVSVSGEQGNYQYKQTIYTNIYPK